MARPDSWAGREPLPIASDGGAPDSAAGVYGISVAAELAGCGIQTLRLYEQRGLITPARTAAGTRRYSLDDINQIRHITGLLGAGLNLTGVGEVLALQAENAGLRGEIERLQDAENEPPGDGG